MDNPKAFINSEVVEVSNDGEKSIQRDLAIEAPLALTYNGVSYVVMMVTPNDLENFIIGFSITEGIVGNIEDIKDIDIVNVEAGLIARIEIKTACFKNLNTKPRNIVGQSSCGLCGVEDLEAAFPKLIPLNTPFKIKFENIQKALKEMPSLQVGNLKTGAMHSAGFVNWAGDIIALQEDVGRHSALDKLIGLIFKEGLDITSGFILLTSRCSYELVQKTITAKAPLLVAVSAPTDLAVKMAKDHKLGLIALARADTMLVLNDPFGGHKV